MVTILLCVGGGSPYYSWYFIFTSDTAVRSDKASLFAIFYPGFS